MNCRLPTTTLLRVTTLISGPLLALLLLASGADALTLDDFEQGTFDLTTDPPAATTAATVVSGLSPVHCVASDRDVRLVTFGGINDAQLHLGSIDDEVQMVMTDGGGRLELLYVPGFPVDLTGGGLFDRIWARLSVAESGARFDVTLVDDTGSQSVASSPPVTGPGGYEILLSDFAGVDVERVVRIFVELQMPVVGDFHLADLRMLENPNGAMAMEALDEGVEGPPYPTASLRFRGSVDGGAGRLVERASVRTTLVAAADDATNPLTLTALAVDAGIAAPGSAAGIVIVDSSPQPWTQAELVLEVLLEPLASQALTELLPPDPIHDGSAFGVEVLGEFEEDGATLVHRLTLVGSVPDDSSVQLVAVQVENLDPEAGSFDLRLQMAAAAARPDRLTRRVEGDLLEIQLVGATSSPQPTSAGSSFALGNGLSARPSVMRGATTLHLTQPAPRPTLVRLFDLRGREVRRLRIDATGRSIRWDGEDADGRPVSAGIYLARAIIAGEALRARVVKLD